MSPEGKNTLITYTLLIVAVVMLYGNTLSGGFVWDDGLFTANQVYWSFDLGKIFFSLANGLEYLPIRDLSYLFDIAVWSGTPFGFHLTNLLLFAAIVILVYQLANRLTLYTRPAASFPPQWFVPILTALIFATHPLKSEVVAWITQRNTLLATLFFLVSVSCFLRYLDKNEKKMLAVSLAAFILALLSKAIVVTLPLLLLFFTVLQNRGGWRQGKFWAPLAPFFILSGAAAALFLAIARQTSVISAAYYGSFSERLAVAVQIPFFYFKKTLLPTDLSAFYAENFAQSLTASATLLSALLLTLLTAVAWLLRKKFPEILLGGGWFMITLLPVSNLLATSPVAADRYMFLPSFGLAFTAAALLGRLRLPLQGLIIFPLLILSVFSALTFRQNRIWQDDITLWRQTAARSPQIAGVWYNLGRALHRTPQLSLALEAYLRAVKLDPANFKSLDNAASLFPSSRGSIAARHELVKSLAEQMPDYPGGLPQIGNVERQWRHPDAAEELFFYLLAADPKSTHLRLAMANFYRKMGADDRAAAILRK